MIPMAPPSRSARSVSRSAPTEAAQTQRLLKSLAGDDGFDADDDEAEMAAAAAAKLRDKVRAASGLKKPALKSLAGRDLVAEKAAAKEATNLEQHGGGRAWKRR